MAKYCKKCGCYIPDGKSACLACGYDEVTEAAEKAASEQAAAKGKGFFNRKNPSSAAAAAKTAEPRSETTVGNSDVTYHGTEGNVEWSDGENWRNSADKKREQRQEWERKWAETEHRRRQMEEQFRQKQKADESQRAENHRTSYRAPQSAIRKTGEGYSSAYDRQKESHFGNTQQGAKRILTVLSYLGAMCFVPMLLYHDDEFSRFHAKQGLILFIFGMIADALSSVSIVGTALLLAKLYLIYKGMMNVLSGKKEKLPFIGSLLG